MSQGNINLTLGLNTSPATQALQQYYQRLNQGAQTAARSQRPVQTSLEKTVVAARKLGFEFDKTTRTFRNARGTAKTIDQIEQEIKQLNAALGKTQQAAKKALGGISQGFQQVIQGIPQGIGLAIGQQLIAPLTNLGSALSGAAKQTVSTFVDLDRALRQTASISGATETEFKELQAAVINLAKDTKFTTGELAEASTALARAGFSAQEAQEALPGIAAGAAAAGSGMQEMSDVVIAALGGFQKSTSETAAVVDILTAAANNSNTTVSELGEGLKYVGPIANSLNMSFEDVAAAAGLLANAGIKASTMGTALRSGLTRLAGAANGSNSQFAKLSRGTGRMATVLQKLGTDIRGTNGDLKSMPELLATLKGGFDNLSSTEKSLAAKILFGDEAGSAWISLLNQNISEIERFTDITNNATGTAAATAEKNLSGIAGSLTFLQSAFDAAGAKVGEFLSAFLKPLVDALAAVLNAFNGLPGPIQNVVLAFGALTVAIGLAAAAYAAFLALKGTGLFMGLGAAISGASVAFTGLAGTIGTKVVAAYGLATAAVAKFNAAVVGGNVGAAATALFGKIVAGAKGAVSALKSLSIGQIFTKIGSGALTAGGAIAKFIAFAAPLATVAVAIGAVAAAWDTYAQIAKGAQEANDALMTGTAALKDRLGELGQEVNRTNKESWDKSVESVGAVQAGLDRFRRLIGSATAEQAKFNQTTNEVYKELDNTKIAIEQGIGAYTEQKNALSQLTQGTSEYKEQQKEVEKTEKVLKGAIEGKIKALSELLTSVKNRNAETEEEKQAQTQATLAIQAAIEELKGLKESYEAVKNPAKGAKDAVDGVTKALSEQQANAKLSEAKDAFNKEMKAMEEAFKNFKAQLQEGIDTEVARIKNSIDGLKEASKVFSQNKDEEIRAIREVAEANKRAARDAIESNRRITEAKVAAIQRSIEQTRLETDAAVAALEQQRSATAAMYDAKISRASSAHSRVMSQMDEELRAIDRQKRAVSDRYDAALEGLRALTPAEEKLRALEIARLQARARAGGEDGLRAQAQLERMQREQQAAEVQKQKEAELAKLEAEAERKREEKRKAEEEFQKKMKALKIEAAEADKKAAEEIAELKKQAAEEEKKKEDEIAKIKEQNAELERKLKDEQLARERQAADQIKRLEEEKRQDKIRTDKQIKKLEEELQKTREQGVETISKAEDAYAERRNDLLIRYRQAIGESHNDIIRTGVSTWTTYANNAVGQLNRVAAAARAAAAAAANAGNTKWTGGPVSAGQIYTVNELGREAFLSASGKLSMIDAPAYGSWKAPSKGTVINAAQTEKLGLPAILDAASRPVQVDPAGNRATATASGSETRNLLRAIARATGGDNITNNVTIQAANTTQAASDVMVDLTKIKRRRIR